MASHSPFERYAVGQVLTLSVIPESSGTIPPSIIKAKIRQLHKPRTLSCCMIVDLLGEGYPDNPFFLKLYDRRFSDQLREDQGVKPWTKDTEKEYIKTVQTGAADQFLHNLHTVANFEDETEEAWDKGQNEVFLAQRARKMFEAETTVYNSLQDIQGKLVPHLLASINLDILPPNNNVGSIDAFEPFCIKGILLQYVQGFSLSKVQDYTPKSEWQGIVDQAVAIVQEISDHKVLNRDVRPDSFMIQRSSSGYKVFMIDFGLARIRGLDESDRDWARAKLLTDEEGAVGLIMKLRLGREDFELQFKSSDRYKEWAGGDDEELSD